MANFGERIAYRYLRFQGFLLVEDFVLHRGDQIEYATDHDLLALRLKHSQEVIDGQILPKDPELENQLAAAGRNVALIVQVKTGTDSSSGEAFKHERLVYAIKFLGIVKPEKADALAKGLADKPSECVGDWTIAKLLIAERPRNTGVLSVTVQGALNFIQKRLACHAERKRADRLRFHDELMQFLAWRALNAVKSAE